MQKKMFVLFSSRALDPFLLLGDLDFSIFLGINSLTSTLQPESSPRWLQLEKPTQHGRPNTSKNKSMKLFKKKEKVYASISLWANMSKGRTWKPIPGGGTWGCPRLISSRSLQTSTSFVHAVFCPFLHTVTLNVQMNLHPRWTCPGGHTWLIPRRSDSPDTKDKPGSSCPKVNPSNQIWIKRSSLPNPASSLKDA